LSIITVTTWGFGGNQNKLYLWMKLRRFCQQKLLLPKANEYNPKDTFSDDLSLMFEQGSRFYRRPVLIVHDSIEGEIEGKLLKLLLSLPSGIDLRYSTSPR